jgi:hypothetical protein
VPPAALRDILASGGLVNVSSSYDVSAMPMNSQPFDTATIEIWEKKP